MLSFEEKGKFLTEALERRDEPIFVNCTGVPDDKIRNIQKVLSAEIFNEKIGHWQKVELAEYIDACSICGKLMRVRAIVGTTWVPACCKEHTKQILDELVNRRQGEIIQKETS